MGSGQLDAHGHARLEPPRTAGRKPKSAGGGRLAGRGARREDEPAAADVDRDVRPVADLAGEDLGASGVSTSFWITRFSGRAP